MHDLYSFALGAYIMIIMSSLLNTVVQKYHIIEVDQGKIDWLIVEEYIFRKVQNVRLKHYFEACACY